MSSPSIAQNLQQPTSDSIVILLKKYINAKDADAIYDLTGKDYQKDLSKAFLVDFLTKQIFPLGEIKETSFISFKNKISNYKLQFDKATIQLSLNLDQDDKLGLFQFKPFRPEKAELVATSNPLQTAFEKEIDAVVRTYIQKPNTVGLSVGVFCAGKNSIYYYGETAKGNGKLPDANTIFEIGSITKTFTATLLAYFVDQGKIKLTDPITKYLPDFAAENVLLKEVSILMLSNHTSGLAPLPDNFETGNFNPINPYQNYTRNQLFAYLKTCKLISKPGEVYAYSNMAVGLLGIILERISGQTYEAMVKTIICKPLNLESTKEYLLSNQKEHFVKVYNTDGNETLTWDFDALQACGSLRSTANDLLKYANANMKVENNDLSKAFQLTHQITFNKNPKVGLGWHIMNINGDEYLWHNGGTGGSRSFLAFNSVKKTAIVILSNSAESVDPVGVGIIKLMQ
ncbi:serine hydrolase [uncultured Mucilaginibacter sp.]|uniref:serine hydrolase n=1 Tax=uncultured Mucilaginibacter sp. TaxID=797541 RepID=UPI00262A5E0A|nr:serine hydrolase [uncultured Mucilaginibacter sp.]